MAEPLGALPSERMAPLPAAPTAAPHATKPPAPEVLTTFLRRGEALLALDDLSGARLFFQRGAQAGSAPAMTALGRSYDPALLAAGGNQASQGDLAAAAFWYRQAIALGDDEARRLLARLEHLGR